MIDSHCMRILHVFSLGRCMTKTSRLSWQQWLLACQRHILRFRWVRKAKPLTPVAWSCKLHHHCLPLNLNWPRFWNHVFAHWKIPSQMGFAFRYNKVKSYWWLLNTVSVFVHDIIRTFAPGIGRSDAAGWATFGAEKSGTSVVKWRPRIFS